MSNFSIKNGHRYFSLKDEKATIKCIVWKSISLPAEPDNGDMMICKGKLDVYLPHGSYQIIVSSCKYDGEGDLNAKFKKLHANLLKQGYFDPEAKRMIPQNIKTIGLVTSENGAVIKDVLSVFHRRNSNLNIILADSIMQGAGCVGSICEALNKLESLDDLDLVLSGRSPKRFKFNSEIMLHFLLYVL